MIHLHNHTMYSKRDGYQTVKELVSRAVELNMEAIGISEHGTSSSLIEFYHECKKQNIKPILGIEMYYTPDSTIKDRDSIYHLLVIAKTTQGYHNLLKLNTIAHKNKYFKSRISLEELEQYKEGLIICSACRGGILKVDNALDIARKFQEVFADNFYIEIQTDSTEDQKEYNFKVLDIAKELNIPVIVSSDTHYARKEDAQYHGKWIDKEEYYPVPDYYIMSEQEVKKYLSYLPKEIVEEAITNTHKIAEQCQVNIEVEGNHYPVYPVDDPYEFMIEQCRVGWREKIVGVIPKEEWHKYVDRLKREFDILQQAGYCNYMLIVWDMLRFCKENNIYVGYGRGSVTGSLVAYLLDITKVNPMKHDLVFERFVHLERVTAGDIDTDIQSDRREEVVNYLREKYGYVYPVRTFQYLSDRGALKRAGQVLKIDPQELNQITTSIEKIDEVKGHKELVELAKHFIGRISAFSSHASAYMIYSKSPENYCSIEKQGDLYLSAYDYHLQEEMNLLKLDLLGIEMWSVVQKTIDMIPDKVDIYSLSLDDKEVYEMLSDGDTSFIFQLESSGMQGFCKQLKPDRFSDIIAILASYRPGPLESGQAQQYIDRKNGVEFEYLHPVMKEVLEDSYGVFIYQEAVMRLVQRMAKMSLGEADMFRRAIGRKDEALMQKIIPEFIERCKQNEIPEDVAETVAHNIHLCSGYLFSLNHGCGYAYLSYASAWLKCKYPLEFFCAMLNSKIGDIDKITEYINECRKRKIKLEKPGINIAQNTYSIVDGKIIVGFTSIKGIGNIEINRPVNSFQDFMEQNTHLNRRVVEGLIKAGALDEIEPNRGLLLGQLEWYGKHGKRIKECEEKIVYYQEQGKEKNVLQWQKKLTEVIPIESVEPLQVDNIDLEIEVLGYSFEDRLDRYDLSMAKAYYQTTLEIIIGGEITEIKPWKTKGNKNMAFIKVRTKEQTVDLVIFNNKYKELQYGKIYLFSIKDNKITDYREAQLK